MAYYSKYTGAELEERLDKVEEIPQLIAQMITGKDFVTKEDLLCVLKDYAPADYRTIPIDNNTIYWENGVLKAATSEGGQCQWELREHNGIQYLYSRLPVVTQYDVTMYADVNHLDLPSIYDGLPIDGDTIYWEETEDGKVLKAKSVGGSGESIDAGWVISVISNAGFATQNWVNNQNFITQSYLATELLKYVTLDNYQEIIGVKNFINGLQISNIPIKKLEGYDDILYIDSNVVIRGGLTMYYEDGDIDLPSIKEEIGNAGYDGTTGLASFNSEHFNISSDGIVSIIGGTGGLDIEQLESYLTSNKYVQQSYVDNAVSNINNRLNDFLIGTDTDTIINKWKELELFLEGLTESDNLAEILTSKASLDYVNSTFVTTAGNEDVTGLHNFVNGLKIGGMRLSKSQDDVVYLEGNLVVKGGVTMYALDEVTVDSIIDSLPLASTSQYGIAKFNPSNFVINKDGFVTIIGGSGGLDTEELAEYLATNKYATQGWVEGKGYITSSALNGYATQSWVTNQKYITGITSAMVVSALGFTPYNSANFTKTNIKSTLGISDWALASTKPSYTFSEIGSKPTTLGGYGITDAYTKTQVNNTFALYIPIAGYTNVTGEKNFTGGLRVNNSPSIYYDATNKYWKLEGDLLVTGGVTMYGTDEGDIPSILDSLPIASTSSAGIASFDSTYFSVNASGKVTLTSASSSISILGSLQDVSSSVSGTTNKDVVLFKSANTSTWTTKLLSEIGGGGSIQRPLRWTGYDSGTWDGTSNGLIVIPTSLKNPNAITFTGAVSATYDGSSAVTVNIPTAGGNIDLSGYLKKSGGAMTGQFSIMAVKSTSGPNIYYTGVTGTAFGRIGFVGVDMPYIWKADATGGYDILHSGNYSSYALPLSGGVMTGDIGLSTIDRARYNIGYAAAGVINEISDYQYLDRFRTFIGSVYFTGGSRWDSVISVRHRNGYSDGNKYGFYLIQPIMTDLNRTDLVFRKQVNGTWGDNYYLLHSGNYSSYALPLTGGTLSNGTNTPLAIKGIADGSWISFINQNSTHKGSIGFQADNQPYAYHTDYGACKIWHSGNDGSDSGLDADLLDGYDSSYIMKYGGNWTSTTDTAGIFAFGFGGSSAGLANNYGAGIQLCNAQGVNAKPSSSNNNANWYSQLLFGTDNRIYARFNTNGGGWSGQNKIAYVTDNVASATKLQTARTIWGQSFDGTGNINGVFSSGSSVSDGILMKLNRTSGGSVVMLDLLVEGNRKGSLGYNGESVYLINRVSGKSIAIRDDNNIVFDGINVGIGTTSPAYKLDVNGTIRFASKTIWGQSFDGTGNVSGNLILGTSGIEGYNGRRMLLESSGCVLLGYDFAQAGKPTYIDGNEIYFRYGTGHTEAMRVSSSGNVGIGTTSPSTSLHIKKSSTTNGDMIRLDSSATWSGIVCAAKSGDVWSINASTANNFNFWNSYLNSEAMVLSRAGNLLVKGGITMYSDIRKKTKLQDVELSLSQIANAPLIQHYYNSDQEKTTHVGSIAQYWANLNDWFCKLDNEGYYTMEIQNCALASAISIARHLEKYESKTDKTIRKMKKRIQELEDEVERLKNN